MNELTRTEATALAKHEKIIEKGLGAFFDVGRALRSIRDDELYRESHKTFDAYCDVRWGMKRSHAYRAIASVQVVDNLSPTGDIVPENEAQARPLAALPDADQQECWRQVVDQAKAESNGNPPRITATLVEEVVKKHTAEPQPIPVSGPQMLDGMKRPVPYPLVPTFSARTEFAGLSKSFSEILNKMLALVEHPGGEQIPAGSLRVEGMNLLNAFKPFAPHVVCPACKGEHCPKCRELGWLTKDQHRGLPREQQ